VNIFAAGGAVTFGGMVISTEKPSPLMGEGLGGADAGRHLDAHGAGTVETSGFPELAAAVDGSQHVDLAMASITPTQPFPIEGEGSLKHVNRSKRSDFIETKLWRDDAPPLRNC
jgi:hypothetical protein